MITWIRTSRLSIKKTLSDQVWFPCVWVLLLGWLQPALSFLPTAPGARITPFIAGKLRECIDYKTSMITDEDPLRGLLFY